MPSTAAFVDRMRDVFGASAVNAAIKGGLAGEGSFYASENGIEIGSRPREIEGRSVNGHDFAEQTPCDGCSHFFLKQLSPDGGRRQRSCRIYRRATGKCADWQRSTAAPAGKSSGSAR